jgi:hypothetical protein
MQRKAVRVPGQREPAHSAEEVTMWKRFLPIGTVTIAVLALSLATAGVAEAGSKDMKYEFHLGDAFLGCGDDLPTDGPIAVIPGDPTCNPEAAAEDFAEAFLGEGGSIIIQGGGELKISKKGKPKHVKGGGLFAQFGEDGKMVSSGKWKAKKLLQFDAYGEDDITPSFPDGFEAGRVLMQIRLDPEDGKKVDAVLEIGCRLPGNKGIVGTIEGARVMVDGGLNYNLPVDPKSTLFVNLQNFVP